MNSTVPMGDVSMVAIDVTLTMIAGTVQMKPTAPRILVTAISVKPPKKDPLNKGHLCSGRLVLPHANTLE